MCIRVRYAPRQSLEEPWDASRLIITLPKELRPPFAMRALRAVLTELDVPQPENGARCWCGEQLGLLPAIPNQQRSDEVINLGA
jgi:hypothetical protein